MPKNQPKRQATNLFNLIDCWGYEASRRLFVCVRISSVEINNSAIDRWSKSSIIYKQKEKKKLLKIDTWYSSHTLNTMTNRQQIIHTPEHNINHESEKNPMAPISCVLITKTAQNSCNQHFFYKLCTKSTKYFRKRWI